MMGAKFIEPYSLAVAERIRCGVDREARQVILEDKNPVGLKSDFGKQQWYAMPLEVLRPLADVFVAGEKKNEVFNCLKPFEDPDRRFWDATMRHLEKCQIDPLARDEETGCYHAAQACFNLLMRIRNAERAGK